MPSLVVRVAPLLLALSFTALVATVTGVVVLFRLKLWLGRRLGLVLVGLRAILAAKQATLVAAITVVVAVAVVVGVHIHFALALGLGKLAAGIRRVLLEVFGLPRFAGK